MGNEAIDARLERLQKRVSIDDLKRQIREKES